MEKDDTWISERGGEAHAVTEKGGDFHRWVHFDKKEGHLTILSAKRKKGGGTGKGPFAGQPLREYMEAIVASKSKRISEGRRSTQMGANPQPMHMKMRLRRVKDKKTGKLHRRGRENDSLPRCEERKSGGLCISTIAQPHNGALIKKKRGVSSCLGQN